jgi:hypothetical protein
MSNNIIPEVDLAKFNNESMRQLADGARESHLTAADETANIAIALAPMVKTTMRHFGADGSTEASVRNGWNILGDPGIAEKMSKELHRALQKAAEADENAAAHWTAAYRIYMQIHELIEEAKRRKTHRSSEMLDY